MGRLIDADALVKRMKNTWDMQDLYLPVHFEDLVEEEPTVGGWISVKDRLPEAVDPDVHGNIVFSGLVLVLLEYEEDGFKYYSVDKCRVDKGIWMHEVPGEGRKVTHWMPLPEPPEGVDE